MNRAIIPSQRLIFRTFSFSRMRRDKNVPTGAPKKVVCLSTRSARLHFPRTSCTVVPSYLAAALKPMIINTASHSKRVLRWPSSSRENWPGRRHEGYYCCCVPLTPKQAIIRSIVPYRPPGPLLYLQQDFSDSAFYRLLLLSLHIINQLVVILIY
jgi:hypothetical protein